jgi:hypothetical protein
MRYAIQEKTVLAGQFDTGGSVNIVIINMDTDAQLSLTTSVCTESAHITGMFLFDTTNISTAITQYTNCAYFMTDGTKNFYGKFSLGGYIDEQETKLDTIVAKDAFSGVDRDTITRIETNTDSLSNADKLDIADKVWGHTQ